MDMLMDPQPVWPVASRLCTLFELLDTPRASDIHFVVLHFACPAGKEGKQMGVPMDSPAFVSAIQQALGEVQASLLAAATAFRDANIVDVTSYDELKAVVAEGKFQW
jgi:hypothetical protein